MADENINGRTGSPGRWPDDVNDNYLYQYAVFHRELGRSLRAAAFGWPQAGSDERAAYLDELAELRKKEQRTWATHFARPLKEE